MISDTMRQLETKENFFSGKGSSAGESLITEVESRTMVSLPEDYQQFLTEYGFAIWFGHRICGVSQLNECSTTHYTTIARNGNLVHADEGIVVMPYEAGGFYILVCSGQRKGQVVLVDTRTNEVVEAWESFSEFAKYLLKVTP